MKKKINYFVLLCFVISTIVLIFNNKIFSNETWNILAQGKSILNNGIYNIDVISMHDGLKLIIEDWLSSCIYWITYSLFKYKGLHFLLIILNIILCVLIYKLCMIISNKNKFLSIMFSIFIDLEMIGLNFIDIGPKIFTYILLILLLILVEKYIQTNKNKYLYFLPLISILQINLNTSSWWWIYLILIIYIIDGHKFKLFHTQGYKKLPIVIATIVSLVAGVINPFGLKSIFYIFNTNLTLINYGWFTIFQFNTIYNKLVAAYVLFIGLIFIFIREGNVRLRYLLLFIITLTIGFYITQYLYIFFLVSSFPLTYFFSDIVNIKLTNSKDKILKIIFVVLMLVGIISFITIPSSKYTNYECKNSIDVLDEIKIDTNENIFSEYWYGGYVEFRGYKPYIDNRINIFLGTNNSVNDYVLELENLYNNAIDPAEFVEKYDFDYILVSTDNTLFDDLDTYELVYKDKDSKLFVKSSLYEKDELEEIKDKYLKKD